MDEQAFDVTEQTASHPGTIWFSWISGPNGGYGFSSTQSDGVLPSKDETKSMARNFLMMIDADTGYIADWRTGFAVHGRRGGARFFISAEGRELARCSLPRKLRNWQLRCPPKCPIAYESRNPWVANSGGWPQLEPVEANAVGKRNLLRDAYDDEGFTHLADGEVVCGLCRCASVSTVFFLD